MRKFKDKRWERTVEYVKLYNGKLYLKIPWENELTRVGKSLSTEEIEERINKHLRSGRFKEIDTISPMMRINKFELV